MLLVRRTALRMALAGAAGTLAATASPSKPHAERLPPLAEGLEKLSPPADLPDGVFVTPDGCISSPGRV